MKLDNETKYTSEMTYIVKKLHDKFYETYHVNPKYVKIPDWLFTELINERDELDFSNNFNPCVSTFMGLKVCPTVEIHTLYDIEVF